MTSVSKALLLLDTFRGMEGEVGVSELARRAGVPKSTAFRLLTHLEQSGYVERAGRCYRLSARLFELGNGPASCRTNGLRNTAKPHLVDLFSATGATVHLATLVDTDVLYVDKIHGRGSIATPAEVGQRRVASTTAVGKSLLAFSPAQTVQAALSRQVSAPTVYSIRQPGRLVEQLRETRRTHLSRDNEESRLGLVCIASPVVVDGRAVAAVSVSLPSSQAPTPQTSAMVRRTAARLARSLDV